MKKPILSDTELAEIFDQFSETFKNPLVTLLYSLHSKPNTLQKLARHMEKSITDAHHGINPFATEEFDDGDSFDEDEDEEKKIGAIQASTHVLPRELSDSILSKKKFLGEDDDDEE